MKVTKLILRTLKRTSEWALSRSVAPFGARQLDGHDRLILAYHNIIPEGQGPVGETILHLPLSQFRRQLNVLQESVDLVTLDEVISRGVSGAERPKVAITFDDAYKGAVTDGLSELDSREIPATIYVPTSRVGEPAFWWDAISSSLGRSLPKAVRTYCLGELRGETARIREWTERNGGYGWGSVPEYAQPADRELLNEARYAGFDLGSHSMSHANLGCLSAEACKRELLGSKEWLETHLGATPLHFSYPYGKSSLNVASHLREHGYATAVVWGGGWFQPDSVDAVALPRFTVPANMSIDGFRLRIARILQSD